MVGQTISHYRILEKLGEGGMGVVYKATDTQLDRTVALKFLSPTALESAEATTRFTHEAKAAATLDHSNICTVYEISEADGQIFLAMAFVDGPSLKEAIAERPLKLDVALDLAIQIAEGLSAAHEAEIVHRDIKPGNILLNRRRQVKILDFGLAHLGAATQITRTGTIIGTPAYMSPEQVRGEKTDRRTDVWSLGVVLYEMLTGHVPFQGESGQAVALSIQNEQPEPPTALRSGIPKELDGIVGKALAKNPNERYQHIEDLLVDVRKLKAREDSTSGQTGVQPARPNRTGWHVAAVMITFLVAVLLTWIVARRAPDEVADAEMSIVPFTTYAGREDNPDFSPDGTQVAFDGNVEDENNTEIYVRMIGSAGLSRLTTNPARDTSPRWSPDGRSIAFVRGTRPRGKIDLMVIPAIGGPERKIAEIGPFGGAHWPSYFDWAPDGTHLVVADHASVDDPLSLYLITTTGNERRRLTSPPPGGGPATGDSGPSFSPDGRFLAFARMSQAYIANIYRLELSDDFVPVREPEQLTSSGDQWRVAPAWTTDGRDIIYGDGLQGGLWRLHSDGSAEPSRLAIAGGQASDPAIDPVRNRLAFAQSTSDTDIWRLELSETGEGNNTGAPFIVSSRDERNPQYSPDGRRIAFTSSRSGANGIWVCDADGKNAAALFVPESGLAGTPRWSPDGRLIVFDSNHEGQWDIYLIRPDGGTPMALTRDGADDYIPSWSRDGKWVYFASTRTGRHEIWKSSADGNENDQATRNGGQVAFESADGKHVYYLKTPAQGTGLWRIPVDGGEEQQVLDAVWSRSFTVTEGGIYFVRPPKGDEPFFSIRRLDPNTEEIENVVSLEVGPNDPRRGVGMGLTISPDQRSILHVRSQSTSDLMLVENFR